MVPHLGPAMMLLRRAGVPAMLRRPAAAGACCRWASVAAVPAGGPGRQRQRRRGSAPGPGPGPASGAEPGPAPARAASAGEPGELVRINKRLSELGLCSRRESDGYIERGLVEVDGEIISLLGTKVTLGAAAAAQQAAKLTVILHKPRGFISASPKTPRQRAAVRLLTSPNHVSQGYWPFGGGGVAVPNGRKGGKHGTSKWPHHWRSGLAPAGRLDMDSTGLLILTQDGSIAKALIGGDGLVDKEYHVTVAKAAGAAAAGGGSGASVVVDDNQLALLCHGLHLDDRPLKPATVEIIGGAAAGQTAHEQRRKVQGVEVEESGGAQQPTAQLRFVLREGRYRQIRRMCEAVGLDVVWLHRVRIGGLSLGEDLRRPGFWRFVTPEEIARLTLRDE